MNEELKHCQFCDTNDKLHARKSTGWASSIQPYEIRCMECGNVFVFPKSYSAKSAFVLWNTRTKSAEFKRLEGENNIMRASIESALRISDIWCGDEWSEEHRGELEALKLMRDSFDKALEPDKPQQPKEADSE